MKALVKVRFMNRNSHGKWDESPKSYNYYIADKALYEYIRNLNNVHKYGAFTIENHNGNNYRNNWVVFENEVKFIEDDKVENGVFTITRATYEGDIRLSAFENTGLFKGGHMPSWPDHLLDLAVSAWSDLSNSFSAASTATTSISDWCSTQLSGTVIDALKSNTTTIKCDSISCAASTASSSYVDDAIAAHIAAEHNKNNKNDNKKENKSMFSTIKNGLRFGFVDDVKMSIYGPAFYNPGQFNNDAPVWEARHDGVWTDVSDCIFDGMKMFMEMPVAKDAIVVGDFIRHGGLWARVVYIAANNRLDVELPFLNEIKTIMPTKNMFGFDYYTKLVCLCDNFKNGFGTNANQPFGMLPMLMMLEDKDGKDSDGLMKMMMMSSMMNGGKMGDFNPMMLMLMSDDKSFDKYLPLMFMTGNNPFMASAADDNADVTE